MSGVILDDQYVNQGIKLSANLIKAPANNNYSSLKHQFTAIKEETMDHTRREVEDSRNEIGGGLKNNNTTTLANSRNQNYSQMLKKILNPNQQNRSFQSVFRDVDDYMLQETQKLKEKKPKDRKILNFCSPIYKKLKREMEHKNRKGYVSLQNKIRESGMMVQHIKNGQSLFENHNDLVVSDYHIPVFREAKLKQSLQDLINKSQDEICVKASKENLHLIECLSPPKIKKRQDEVNQRRSSLNQTSESMIASYQEEKLQAPPDIIRSKQKSMLPVIQKRNSVVITDQLQSRNEVNHVNQSQDNIGEDFNRNSYQDRLNQINDIKKSFEFPINPAFQQQSKRKKRKKLKFLTEYCRENKIAMSNNEELIMNMDYSKLQHSVWKSEVSHIYDNKQKKFKTDQEELIDVFRNFDNLNLNKTEIQGILQKYEDRKKELQEYKRQQIIKNQKYFIPKTLDDEYSIINQVRKIKFGKQRLQATSVPPPAKGLVRASLGEQQHRQSNKLEVLLKSYASKRNSILRPEDRMKMSRIESRGSISNKSDKNSLSSKTSKRNTKTTVSKNSTSFGPQSMSQQMLLEHLAKIQQEKKKQEEERLRQFLEEDRLKMDKLKKLQQQLDNPYMLTKLANKKLKKRRNSKMSQSSQKNESDTSQSMSKLPNINNTQEDSDEDSEQKQTMFKPTKEFKKKPIVKLIKAAQNITSHKKKINHDLIKLLERYDLDRPLMLKEKLDIIWKEKRNEPILLNNISSTALIKNQSLDSIKSIGRSPVNRSMNQSRIEKDNTETLNLRYELDKRKQARLQLNNQQKEIYNKILGYLDKRGKAIQNEEKQFMNIIKIIIEGGWLIRETEIEQILNMIELKDDDPNMNKKARFEQNQELVNFFKNAMNEFGFTLDLIYFIEFKKGMTKDQQSLSVSRSQL